RDRWRGRLRVLDVADGQYVKMGDGAAPTTVRYRLATGRHSCGPGGILIPQGSSKIAESDTQSYTLGLKLHDSISLRFWRCWKTPGHQPLTRSSMRIELGVPSRMRMPDHQRLGASAGP